MSRRLLATLAVAASALATGCGGSSKPASRPTKTNTPATRPTTPSNTPATSASSTLPTVEVHIASGKALSRAQWIARGDAICAHTNAEINTVHVKATAELPRVLPQVAAYERIEVNQLAKLVPPTTNATAWHRFLVNKLQIAEGATKLVQFASLGDAITRAPLYHAMTQTHEQAAKIARKNGFQQCAT